MKRQLLTALILAAALILTACGADSASETPGSMPASVGAPPASIRSGAGSDSDSASNERNDADVAFVQMMLPHHRQAVEMSELMLAKDGISPEVTDLATRIAAAQAPEIDTMTGWLEAWGEALEADDGMEGHDMGSHSMEDMQGMMTEDQLAELESAGGTEASRLFLESMTAHHEGAVAMAQDELEGGLNREALDLAASIVESQQAEISEMEQLLSDL